MQLGQVRPSPPRVGAKVEALSPEDNLFYFALVDALLPSEELGEGQLRLSFCGVGLNGEKSSLVVKARDVRRQGGKIVRGRPTAHAAPPVSAPQTSGGSTIKAAPVALRLPPMGAGGLPGKGRGSAIASPPAGRPSPNPSPVASAYLPPGSNRPPSHGDIRPEASVPKPLLKPPPNPRPPSFPGDPVSIEPSTPSRVAVNPSTAAQPPSFGQASPHYNSSSPQPAPPPKHRERPPPLQAPPGASATRTLPPVAGIHSPPQPGASPNHLHRVPSFDPDASGVEPPAAQAGGNTTGGFVRVMSHEINQALQASRGRGSSAGVVRSLSHDLQRNSPHQRPLPMPHGARPEGQINALRSGGSAVLPPSPGGHFVPPPLGGSAIMSARSGLRPTPPPKPTHPL